MESIEKSARTVEEATENALSELGLNRSEVNIEVLSEGKVGLWGFGGEDARVKVTPLPRQAEAEVQADAAAVTEAAPAVAQADTAAVTEAAPAVAQADTAAATETAPAVAQADTAAATETAPAVAQADVAAIAKEVVERLLFLMKVPATAELREGEIPPAVAVDINGDDLGLLIGRRGQTLATFQYMVSLMVSRRLKSGVRVSIDIAGYRQRREEELHNLALRLAELVKSTRRAITLDPMSPSERRIVHMALRDDTEVITQSIGEEENRKVIISLRRR